jgi:hypothetical protein
MRNVYSQLSGLEDMVFNDFIKDDFIPEDDGQVESGSVSLPDPVVSVGDISHYRGADTRKRAE